MPRIFGITLAAFQLAGGLLLLLVALDSLRAKRSEVQETEEEKNKKIIFRVAQAGKVL